MKNYLNTFALVGLALFLCGCSGFLKPQPDKTEFFILTPRVWAPEASPYKCARSIAVQRVDFSEYLDNSEIATRPARERIQYAPFMRWAEPLASGLSRTLVVNLGMALGNQMVVLYPNRLPGFLPEAVLYTNVIRFDGTLGENCVLVVCWRLTAGDGKTLLYDDNTVLKKPSGETYESYVRALSALWSDFADIVAQKIAELDAAKKLVPPPEN